MQPIRCAGISLIELMLSLLLGSILLLSAINLLAHTVKGYQQQQRQIHQLEKLRMLDFIFSRAIHMAGFFGCRSRFSLQPHNNLRSSKLANRYIASNATFPPALLAYHVTEDNQIPIFIRQHAKPDSDVLIVSHLDTNTTVLQQNMFYATSPLQLRDKLSLKINTIVLVNDCENADVFAVSNISDDKGVTLRHQHSVLNATDKLSKAYLQGTQLGKCTCQLFYLNRTKKQPLTYGLFRQDQSDI